MTSHFSFSKLVVSNLDRSAAFYEEVAGVTQHARIEAEICGRQMTEIVYRPTARGGAMLVLLQYADTERPPAGETIVGFMTPGVDDWVCRAQAAGATVVEPPTDRPEVGLRVAFVTDPEGHLIEICQTLG